MKPVSKTNPKNQVLIEANRLAEAGFSPISILADGSKKSAVPWKPYQHHIATPKQLEVMFSRNGCGIGIVTGAVSGNYEAIDFDDPLVFGPWKELVKQSGGAELLKKLSIAETPTGGRHVSYRCAAGIERNQKLAQRKIKGERPKVLIETRGEGGYIIVPGSPAACHPLKKVYKQLNVSPEKTPDITGEERELLLNAARALNEYIKPAQVVTGRGNAGGNRPGDDFNERGSWEEILEPRGWKKVGSRGETTDWQRPGKTIGSSATTNHAGTNHLYVFSTNSHPFEEQRYYYKFAAYALLHHGGDWKTATIALVKKGYGSSEQKHSIPYRASSSGLYRRKTETDGGYVDVQLTNFNAQICADVFQDDGVEIQCFTEIKAQLKGQTFQFVVPAKQFQGMQWVAENLGAGAVLYAGFGSKDHARVAIQLLSKDIPTKKVYTHTGWREVNNRWVYLHADGALGHDGPVSGIDVQLDGGLSRYRLTRPDGDLVESIQASLRFLDVAPDRITIPLFCGIWRAIVGEVDCSLHLAGQTGEFKTELAALCVQHFGSEMNRMHLPANWSSTENALEGIAFKAKDALLVIDDFMPTGTRIDVLKMHAKADRVLRAQGNKSGRIRMRQDASLRYAKPPRGLILSTGEDTPKGHSLKARLWNCDISPGDVKKDRLTLCQRDAANGLYVGATVGFIQWLAPRYETVLQNLPDELRELRDAASKDGMHRRTPDIIANLAIGLRLFLDYAKDSGAITAEQRQELWDRGWAALIEGAAVQQEQQSVDEPTQQYLELLRAALDSGKAYIADRDGYEPDNSRAWGWVDGFNGEIKHQGNCVGWVDGDDLYLQPKASYAAAQTMGAASGGSLVVTETTLWKRLKGKNLLCSMDDGRLTKRVVLAGSRKPVLHLRSDVLAQVVAQSAARKSGGFEQKCASANCCNQIG